MPPRAHIVVALTMAAVLALASHAAGAEDRGGRPSQASDRSGVVGSMRRAARPDAATLAIALAETYRAFADARGGLRQALERYRDGAKAARQVARETRSLATDGGRRIAPEHDYRATARVPGVLHLVIREGTMMTPPLRCPGTSPPGLRPVVSPP
jgi:uncharacterized protein YggE